MKTFLAFLVFLAVTFGPRVTFSQECSGACLSGDDAKVVAELLKDQKCRSETKPDFKLDPVTIVVDEQGRVYGSGADPHPYTVRLSWCNYTVEAKGKVQILAAKKIPQEWGFRFRPKFTAGYLPLQAFEARDGYAGLDAGIVWEGFYWKWLNLNLLTNVRSSGVAVGVDLTRNFGLYGGYVVAYEGWRSNPYVGVGFAFW